MPLQIISVKLDQTGREIVALQIDRSLRHRSARTDIDDQTVPHDHGTGEDLRMYDQAGIGKNSLVCHINVTRVWQRYYLQRKSNV